MYNRVIKFGLCAFLSNFKTKTAHQKKICLLFLSIVLINKIYSQQNIQFTQYAFNSLSVNPAYTGYKEVWFAQMALRSQWTGWAGAPKTGTISIDGVLNQQTKRHGVGIHIIGDQLGAQAATSVYANYALRLQLNNEDEHRLSLGLAGGITQYSLDGNKLEYIDDNDVAIPYGKISTWKPDIRLGIYYNNSIWYLGAAVHDLFANSNSAEDFQFNQNSLESLYRKIHAYMTAGALFELGPGVLLRPSLMIKDDFKGPTVLDVNTMFVFNDRFWIGGGYRTRARFFQREYDRLTASKLSSRNGISGITQFYINPRFRVGYSYDHRLGNINGLQNGTHEITLGVILGSQLLKSIVSPRYF